MLYKESKFMYLVILLDIQIKIIYCYMLLQKEEPTNKYTLQHPGYKLLLLLLL